MTIADLKNNLRELATYAKGSSTIYNNTNTPHNVGSYQEILSVGNQGKDGYHATANYDPSHSDRLLIIGRGSVSKRDLVETGLSWFGLKPYKYIQAMKEFRAAALNKLQEMGVDTSNITVIHIGHSKGGYEAKLSAVIHSNDLAIAFDAPNVGWSREYKDENPVNFKSRILDIRVKQSIISQFSAGANNSEIILDFNHDPLFYDAIRRGDPYLSSDDFTVVDVVYSAYGTHCIDAIAQNIEGLANKQISVTQAVVDGKTQIYDSEAATQPVIEMPSKQSNAPDDEKAQDHFTNIYFPPIVWRPYKPNYALTAGDWQFSFIPSADDVTMPRETSSSSAQANKQSPPKPMQLIGSCGDLQARLSWLTFDNVGKPVALTGQISVAFDSSKLLSALKITTGALMKGVALLTLAGVPFSIFMIVKQQYDDAINQKDRTKRTKEENCYDDLLKAISKLKNENFSSRNYGSALQSMRIAYNNYQSTKSTNLLPIFISTIWAAETGRSSLLQGNYNRLKNEHAKFMAKTVENICELYEKNNTLSICKIMTNNAKYFTSETLVRSLRFLEYVNSNPSLAFNTFLAPEFTQPVLDNGRKQAINNAALSVSKLVSMGNSQVIKAFVSFCEDHILDVKDTDLEPIYFQAKLFDQAKNAFSADYLTMYQGWRSAQSKGFSLNQQQIYLMANWLYHASIRDFMRISDPGASARRKSYARWCRFHLNARSITQDYRAEFKLPNSALDPALLDRLCIYHSDGKVNAIAALEEYVTNRKGKAAYLAECKLAYDTMAMIHMLESDPKKAVKNLKARIKLDPNDLVGIAKKGALTGKLQDRITLLEKLTDRFPNSAELTTELQAAKALLSATSTSPSLAQKILAALGPYIIPEIVWPLLATAATRAMFPSEWGPSALFQIATCGVYGFRSKLFPIKPTDNLMKRVTDDIKGGFTIGIQSGLTIFSLGVIGRLIGANEELSEWKDISSFIGLGLGLSVLPCAIVREGITASQLFVSKISPKN